MITLHLVINNKYIKLASNILLLVVALWTATPKSYIHELLDHHHACAVQQDQTELNESHANDDCEFNKYNSPVNFNSFSFPYTAEFSFAQKFEFNDYINDYHFLRSNIIYQLRAPPATA